MDAFNSYLSNEPYFLKQQGVEFTVLNPRNYGVDFYSDILFTTEDELKQHPERVKAFRQASLEGWYYAMDHPQEIIDCCSTNTKSTNPETILNFEADAIRSLISTGCDRSGAHESLALAAHGGNLHQGGHG